jgi:hypothetical protein
MKRFSILILILPLFVACGQGDQDTNTSHSDDAQVSAVANDGELCNEVAIFSVDGLDMTMAGQLAQVLAELPGVITAKPVVAEGKFAVQFTNPTSTPKALLDAFKTAGVSATLLDVKPAEAKAGAKSACDGCPSKSKCAGS